MDLKFETKYTCVNQFTMSLPFFTDIHSIGLVVIHTVVLRIVSINQKRCFVCESGCSVMVFRLTV